MDRLKNGYITLATAVLVGGLIGFNWENIKIRFQLWRVEGIIQKDDMGWPRDVDEIIGDLKKSTNKRHLAEILLSQSNGSLVAEGMVIVVEESFPDGDKILSSYAKDKRWNYWLTFNSDFSQVSLSAWKIKMNKPLTVSERKFLQGWQNTLDATFKIKHF
jgi:hypothetical protein